MRMGMGMGKRRKSLLRDRVSAWNRFVEKNDETYRVNGVFLNIHF